LKRLLFWLLLSPVAIGQIFDPSAIDSKVNPCEDFYRYSCGHWIATHPIPPNKAAAERSSDLRERNQRLTADLIAQAARESGPPSTPQRQIADYYAACMNESAIEQRGLATMQPVLDRVRAAQSKRALFASIAALRLDGVEVLFALTAEPDWKNSDVTVAALKPIRLSLPEPDLYSQPKGAALRAKFATWVWDMFVLLGDDRKGAAAESEAVLRIETALAANTPGSAEARDPARTYHKTAVKDLPSLGADFDWREFFTAVGRPDISAVNVSSPAYLNGLKAVIEDNTLESWKSWFRWRIIRFWAGLLPRKFVEREFEFAGKVVQGSKSPPTRPQRCSAYLEFQFEDALGRLFASRVLGPSGKTAVEALARDLERELGAEIRQAKWMSQPARKEALAKLQAISHKIGHPDSWVDYSSVNIAPDDFLGNYRRLTAFHKQRSLAQVGKPSNRALWDGPVSAINAFYNVQLNAVTVPAGILQSPFYENSADPAELYGAIGTIIGHELTHGFDDQGRKIDSHGNLRNWWTPADEQEFQKRARCFLSQYGAYEVLPGLRVDSARTLGENLADNGGARLAWGALAKHLQSQGATPAKAGAFTPQQRFFLTFAQLGCQNIREEALRAAELSSPHAPNRARVNGVVRNMPEFFEAFSCPAQQRPAPADQCGLW
jgi:putative endopeptidase